MSRLPGTLSSGLSLAQMQHLNEQCNCFEAAWKSGTAPRIEDFLTVTSVRPLLLQHLIQLDVEYRRRQDDSPRPEDYLSRFPDLAPAWLSAALADAPSDATGLLEASDTSPGISVSEFLDRVVAWGFLSERERQALRSQLPDSPSLETVMNFLIAQGKLAEFQARALAAAIPVPLELGAYVLDGWIAAGGMGNVFRATHQRMKRTVAVKVLHAAARPDALQRFQREVELAARLRHPNIITAFDAGEQNGIAYLVTEFVEGVDLGRLVKRDGPLSADRALDFIRQSALGLGHAHAQGIIHRDVKPSNLILGRDGTVRVLDVGLARAVPTSPDGSTFLSRPDGTASVSSLTGIGEVMGTVDYMAPEQAEDPRRADARSDIYSLGCTLHYLLTGRPPYDGATNYARLLAHRQTAIPSFRAVRLDALLQRMLAKKPQDRFNDTAALLAALDPRTPPGRRFSRRALLAVGCAVAVVGAVGVLGWFREGRKPELPPLPQVPFDARTEQRRWAEALGVPVQTENAIGMQMILIPPGSFLMGTPDPIIQRKLTGVSHRDDAVCLKSEQQREVTIAEPFYLGRTEVTLGQFRRFLEANPKYVTQTEQATDHGQGGWGWTRNEGWQRRMEYSWKNVGDIALDDAHPVGNLSWADAQAFCGWLSEVTGEDCRLPTEAEWEFACRAGSADLWSFGDEEAKLRLYSWTSKTSEDRPHPVAELRPNAFGLFDMHGNQSEWCAASEAAQNADRAFLEAMTHSAVGHQPVRGGHFRPPLDATRSAARRWLAPEYAAPGFRVLQVIPRG